MGRHWRDRRLSVAPPLLLGSSPCISPSLLLQETHHLGPPPGYPWPRSFCSAQRPLKLLIFPGTSRPVPLRPRLQSLQPWFISGPSQGSRSPSISPLPRPSGPRPYGHTLNSAIVRLRLYRFSERKLLRELLMKTVTVGADNPVTSISPRPAGSRSWVCCLTPALQPLRPLLGNQSLPLLPTWPIRALAQGKPANRRCLLTTWPLSRIPKVGPANPERPAVVHSSSNSGPGNGPGGRRLKPKGRTGRSYPSRRGVNSRMCTGFQPAKSNGVFVYAPCFVGYVPCCVFGSRTVLDYKLGK